MNFDKYCEAQVDEPGVPELRGSPPEKLSKNNPLNSVLVLHLEPNLGSV